MSGPARFAQSLLATVQAAGGECRLGATVQRIRVDNGRVVGVEDWVAERLLAQFARHFPALAPRVRYHEAATPLTQRRFVDAAGGSIYGLAMTVERWASDALRLRTPVPGLLLAGQDVMGPGVQAAFMGGLMAAATVEPALWRALRR